MEKLSAALGICPSMSMGELLREAETRPVATFDRCPIADVRGECIKTLEEREWGVSGSSLPADVENLSDWAENRICALLERHDLLWKRLLEWYVFHAGSYGRGRCDEETAVRAIEFAVTLAKEQGWMAHADAVHSIFSRLRRDGFLYWHVPSMKSFLEWLLSTETKRNSATSWSFGWSSAERAVRRIVGAEDVTFLSRLEGLAGVENWEVVGGSDPFGLAIQSAVIVRAVKMLREAREKQMPDLNATVGARLRKEAKLSGSVAVHVNYPESVTVGEEALIRVWFGVTTKASEVDELVKILPRLSVHLKCEWLAFTGQPYLAFESGSDAARVTVKPTRGNNRFWLSFELEKASWREKGGPSATEREKLAEMACYIFCE